MEDEWEEESTLVVELSGVIDKDFLMKDQQECHVLGIDTERPLLQIGSYVFSGKYEDSLGTCVLFAENSQTDSASKKKSLLSAASGPAKLNYLCHTRKKLIMQRAFLNEKKSEESEELVSNGETAANMEAEEADEPQYPVESSWPIGFDSGIDVMSSTEASSTTLQKKPRFDQDEPT
ncbi:general transcription factor 3C polypeptide 6-like [Gigantopelta aegis]|uniref:general transcription factor 3C polypeptide 6-like n=1 Tax=Gigantopelta aegis TaxID=1735272 RepID=UPI001B887834|nr:general transcription factor 3C polypeptide 6-like [Gigantopelta aegis]